MDKNASNVCLYAFWKRYLNGVTTTPSLPNYRRRNNLFATTPNKIDKVAERLQTLCLEGRKQFEFQKLNPMLR